jgi:hypothetical protein
MGEINLEDMMNKESLEVIMVTIFCSIGFWFLVTSGLSMSLELLTSSIKTLTRILLSYKKVDVFGRLSTVDFEENWFEIILANNKTMRIYAIEIKTRKMKFTGGFVFCQIKYNLLKFRWEYEGLYFAITGESINRPINGCFGDFEGQSDE